MIHSFWVPAFRLKTDAVPGHHHAHPRHARQDGQLPRSSAPSCAASATRPCARPCASSTAGEFDAWLASRRQRRPDRRDGHGVTVPPCRARREDLRGDACGQASRAPGWYRAAARRCRSASARRVRASSCGVRALYGWDPIVDGNAITTVAMISMPLAFLVGIGCFDYWFRWASGAPTIPEDHSGHGATHVAGLLPGQHRPQGHRDPVHRHDVLLLHHRRPDGDAHARRAGARRARSSWTRTPSTGCSRCTPR